MSHIAKTMFEVLNSNITRNGTQNVPGTYATLADSTYTADICPAGFLTVHSKLMDNDGYQGKGASGTNILNGNTWVNIKAANGAAASLGDHTGVYAFNSYNVRRVGDGQNVWNLGSNFLGLELPAGEVGDFTEIIIGEQYGFGTGNFSTVPASAAAVYVTIVNGLLVAGTSAPSAGDGLYFKWLRKKTPTVGAHAADFDEYVLLACRA